MTSPENFCAIALGLGQTRKLQKAALEHITRNKNWCAHTGAAGAVCCPGEGAIVPCGMIGKLMGCSPFLGPPCNAVARIAQTKAANGSSDKPGSICFVYCPLHLRTAGAPSEMRVIRAHQYVQIAMQDFLARNPCELVLEQIVKFRAMWADRQEILLACLISSYATRNWMAVRAGEERPHWTATAPKDGIITPSQSGKSGSLSIADYLVKAKALTMPIKAAFAKASAKPSPASTAVANRATGQAKGKPKHPASATQHGKGNDSQSRKLDFESPLSKKPATKVMHTPPQHFDMVVPKWKATGVKRGFDELAAAKGISGLALFQEMQKTYGKLSPGPTPKRAAAVELAGIKAEVAANELARKKAKRARREAKENLKLKKELDADSEEQAGEGSRPPSPAGLE